MADCVASFTFVWKLLDEPKFYVGQNLLTHKAARKLTTFSSALGGKLLEGRMASKTYIYRDLVSGAEMFNVANPHVSHPQ